MLQVTVNADFMGLVCIRLCFLYGYWECVSNSVMCFLYFLCRSVWAVVCIAVSAATSCWERRWPLLSTRYVWGEESIFIGQGECVRNVRHKIL